MNIKDYISSGVLEAYLLGELTDAARAEVEEMAMEHVEVREELNRIEEVLFGLTNTFAIEPPLQVKQRLMDKLEGKSVAKEDPKVKPITTNTSEAKPLNTIKWMLAASVIITLISTIAAFSYWNKWKNTQSELKNVLAQNELMAESVQQTSLKLVGLKEDFNILNDSSMVPVMMKGLEKTPNALAMVHWNHHNKQVYLNAKNLPEPTQGKQYQLWAIVDGKPVDAGVFNMASATNGLVKMKDIDHASAFAVTLEPTGGSKSPTMEAMVVMGNVKS